MTNHITVAGIKIPTLLAITLDEQVNGLMHKNAPLPVMSFLYNSPKINKFWMKNVKAPLEIVFCLANTITAIHYGEPFSTKIIGDDHPSDLVVEFPSGTCNQYGINVGNSIELHCSDADLMKLFMVKNGFII